MSKTMNLDSVLTYFEQQQENCKRMYWETVKDRPRKAAEYSRVAAAYEDCHVRLSLEMGVKSRWEDSGAEDA